MSNQQQQINTEVTTGEVRLSYVHVFQARQRGNQEPKKSVTILVPKSDIATKQRLDAAIAGAIQMGVSGKWNGVRPPVVATPIHDGDQPRPSDGMPFGEECRGHWAFTASEKADRNIEIVDMNLNPILNQTEIYSGMYGRVSVRFFPYFSEGKKGIGCGLGPIQKTRDGEPLASVGPTAAQAFGAPMQVQPQYQQPVAQQYQQQYAAPVQQPQYAQPAPQYQQPAPQQPQYAQPAPQQYQQPAPQQYQQPAPQQYQQPVQQQYAPQQPQQPAPIDPITGQPVAPPVMGI